MLGATQILSWQNGLHKFTHCPRPAILRATAICEHEQLSHGPGLLCPLVPATCLLAAGHKVTPNPDRIVESRVINYTVT
jgi:hypothetical protein